MTNDSNIIAAEVDSLNKMMETDEYQNASHEQKQKMIFAVLNKFETEAKKKSSKKKVK